jgi:hypothetical protein
MNSKTPHPRSIETLTNKKTMKHIKTLEHKETHKQKETLKINPTNVRFYATTIHNTYIHEKLECF